MGNSAKKHGLERKVTRIVEGASGCVAKGVKL